MQGLLEHIRKCISTLQHLNSSKFKTESNGGNFEKSIYESGMEIQLHVHWHVTAL